MLNEKFKRFPPISLKIFINFINFFSSSFTIFIATQENCVRNSEKHFNIIDSTSFIFHMNFLSNWVEKENFCMRECIREGKLKYKSKFRLPRYFIIKCVPSPNVLTDILIQSFMASKMSSNLLLSYTDLPQFFIVFLSHRVWELRGWRERVNRWKHEPLRYLYLNASYHMYDDALLS